MNNCVMCGEPPEERIDQRNGQIVKIYFIDPRTKEQLCEKCNTTNNGIYIERGEKHRGELRVIQ